MAALCVFILLQAGLGSARPGFHSIVPARSTWAQVAPVANHGADVRTEQQLMRDSPVAFRGDLSNPKKNLPVSDFTADAYPQLDKPIPSQRGSAVSHAPSEDCRPIPQIHPQSTAQLKPDPTQVHSWFDGRQEASVFPNAQQSDRQQNFHSPPPILDGAIREFPTPAPGPTSYWSTPGKSKTSWAVNKMIETMPCDLTFDLYMFLSGTPYKQLTYIPEYHGPAYSTPGSNASSSIQCKVHKLLSFSGDSSPAPTRISATFSPIRECA